MSDDPRDVQSVAAHFDDLYGAIAGSPTYSIVGTEAFGGDHPGQLGLADTEDLYRLAEAARMHRGALTLDLASGMGRVADWMARKIGARVIGIDCSRVGVAESIRADPTGRFAVAAIGATPFQRNVFDSVVCLDGFGAGMDEALRECSALLRPGGGLGFLLNVPAPGADSLSSAAQGDFERVAAAAGFDHVTTDDRTARGRDQLERWLAASKRLRPRHRAELGDRIHDALIAEMEALLNGFKAGSIRRLLLSATKPGTNSQD